MKRERGLRIEREREEGERERENDGDRWILGGQGDPEGGGGAERVLKAPQQHPRNQLALKRIWSGGGGESPATCSHLVKALNTRGITGITSMLSS